MNTKRSFCAAIIVFLSIMVAAPALAGFEVCNRSAARLNAIVGGYEDRWLVKGWYNLDPGECITPYTSSAKNRNFYVFAKSNTELTRWLHGKNLRWSGYEGVYCPPKQAFKRRLTLSNSSTECSGTKAKMLKVESDRTHYSFHFTDNASPARTLKEAKQWHTILSDRMEFEKARGTKARFPFSIGVSVKKDSMRIDRVYAGLPAHWVGIEKGDILYSVGAKRVHSIEQFAKEINKIGMRFNHDVSVQITVLRDGELLMAETPLEYTYFLDPRRTDEEATEAFARATADSVVLGAGSTVYCYGGSLIGDTLDWVFNGDDRFARTQRAAKCAEADQKTLDRLRRMYPDQYGWGDIVGAFAGTFRVVARGWLKLGGRRATLLGSSSLARLAENMMLEGLEGALTAVGQSNKNTPPEQVFKDAVAAGKLGLGIGAVTAILN